MTCDEALMRRCFELASKGRGHVSPNPLVGCVITAPNGRIVSEGYHQQYGQNHAERNALLRQPGGTASYEGCSLYVNLEPCSHYGKTPPCADLIIEKKIKRVVISTPDPNPLVAGQGLAKLRAAGIEVAQNILFSEGRHLNRRFFTFMEKKRPYVILKWAETADGFMDIDRNANPSGSYWITNATLKTLSHRWRTSEDAIMVGANTVANDNPQLTARLWGGRSPLRITIDRTGRLPKDSHLFDGSLPTMVFTENKTLQIRQNLTFVSVDFSNLLPAVLKYLHQNKVQSLIVEGGKQLIDSFLKANLWDEARQLIGNVRFSNGLPAPKTGLMPDKTDIFADNTVNYYFNQCSRTLTEP